MIVKHDKTNITITKSNIDDIELLMVTLSTDI